MKVTAATLFQSAAQQTGGVDMASASSFPCEEQFHCSICLHVFTDPVTTPCGHNYCKACITEYWDSCVLMQCPLCKERFRSRPQLRVNTGFRDMLEHFSRMSVTSSAEEKCAGADEVRCDLCVLPKLKAQKTCLVCKVSYCHLHLEPHRRTRKLQKHKLTDPVSNPETRLCKRHGEVLDMFCCDVCVCCVCLKDHKTHNAIPLEEAYRKKRGLIQSMAAYAETTENSKSMMAEVAKRSFPQKKKESEQEMSDIRDAFKALEATLQRNQVELLEHIQDEQKMVESHTEAFIRHHEGDASELKRIRVKMEQALQTEDHVHFLQNIPTFDFIERQVGFNTSRQRYVETVKKAVARIEKALGKEFGRLMREVRASAGQWQQAEGVHKDEWDAPEDKLMMIQQNDAVDVTLDPYTAYIRLSVSDDRKRLTVRERQFNFYGIMGRNFLHQPLVLATEGFSSGRFYFEVQVSGCEAWQLGVVKESVRKDTFSFPAPEDGGWMLTRLLGKYFANHSSVHLRQRPRTVGVFVDYEKGEVSFYDVEARALIHSYTECTFTEALPVLKAALYTVAGYSTNARAKLYPVVGIFDEDSEATLLIAPVSAPAPGAINT